MKKQKVRVVDGSIVCEYPSIGKTLKFLIANYPASILADARDHGFEQKFGDAKSGDTAQAKYDEVKLIHESLMRGEWTRTASPIDQTPEVLAAVAKLKKLKHDVEKGTLSNGKASTTPTKEQVAEWRQHPEVKAAILENRLAKAKENLKAAAAEELVVEIK